MIDRKDTKQPATEMAKKTKTLLPKNIQFARKFQPHMVDPRAETGMLSPCQKSGSALMLRRGRTLKPRMSQLRAKCRLKNLKTYKFVVNLKHHLGGN